MMPPELLERSLGTCRSCSSSSTFHPPLRHLFWGICEGNDLEDRYAERQPGGPHGRLARVSKSTFSRPSR